MQKIYRDINSCISVWIKNAKSNREFAISHNIDEKTVRRLLDEKEYRISIGTLQKICESRNLSLSDFFKLVEKLR
ncbi:helix-turn-helix domain-containing protein [Zunongwangia sp. HGR-M22]|nr:helix-turn-helix domain-containing protein [Zunongwangia sp. HGR-M22]WBL26697.1 helix-turn-helix domain-containing protein [Zunongwangia sp. HGR-M22]